MNKKKIVIIHYCYGNEELCFFMDKLKYIMKDYPDDAIIENRIVKRNVHK